MAHAQSSTRIDRLSGLPPEVLGLIFSHIPPKGFVARNRPYSPLVISKALLPYTRRLVFERVVLHSWSKTKLLIRSIVSQAGLGVYVHDIVLNLDNGNTPQDVSDAEFTNTQHFWSELNQVRSVDIGGCFALLESFLGPSGSGLTKRITFTQLKRVYIEGDFRHWANPLSFHHWRPLFLLAPALSSFWLTVNFVESAVDEIATDSDSTEDDLVLNLNQFSLDSGCDRVGADQIVKLCNRMSNLGVLTFYNLGEAADPDPIIDMLDLPKLKKLRFCHDDSEGVTITSDLSKFPLLTHVEASVSPEYDAALLARLPASVTHLTFGSITTFTTAELNSLILPNSGRAPTLTHIDVDGCYPYLETVEYVWVGPRIGAGPVPVLVADRQGKPVFEPLPGWKRPDWTGERPAAVVTELMDVRRRAERAGLTLGGDLFEALAVEEAWIEEVAACARLQGQYEKGELEWQVYEAAVHRGGARTRAVQGR